MRRGGILKELGLLLMKAKRIDTMMAALDRVAEKLDTEGRVDLAEAVARFTDNRKE